MTESIACKLPGCPGVTENEPVCDNCGAEFQVLMQLRTIQDHQKKETRFIGERFDYALDFDFPSGEEFHAIRELVYDSTLLNVRFQMGTVHLRDVIELLRNTVPALNYRGDDPDTITRREQALSFMYNDFQMSSFRVLGYIGLFFTMVLEGPFRAFRLKREAAEIARDVTARIRSHFRQGREIMDAELEDGPQETPDEAAQEDERQTAASE